MRVDEAKKILNIEPKDEANKDPEELAKVRKTTLKFSEFLVCTSQSHISFGRSFLLFFSVY